MKSPVPAALYGGGIMEFLRKCRRARANPLVAAWNRLRFRARGLDIVARQGVFFAGIQNIETRGPLEIGMNKLDYMHPADRTVVNVRGRLRFDGAYILSQGCRVDVGPGALAVFGPGFTNANTVFMVMHHLKIGADCVIAWNCQFVDDDFHQISYPGREPPRSGIEVGDRVWVGANVTVLKGTRIADGCVVGANSLVSGNFAEPGCLIAGNPARVIRRGVTWSVDGRPGPAPP